MLPIIFILGYLGIAFENTIKINKTATALLTGVFAWSFYMFRHHDSLLVNEQLSHHLANIAEILFFLLGAMTIVEVIDAHQGFKIITDRIRSKNYVNLLWIIALLSFFLSAILDNLTTAIVMASILKKLIPDTKQRIFLAGIVIIAANAGGAWSPIGDVTTTMLWIGGQITAVNIIKQLFFPSLICLIIPLIFLTFKFKGEKIIDSEINIILTNENIVTNFERNVMFFVGIGMLLFVPIFKTLTHLPPYLGMLLGLGVVGLVGEIIHGKKDEEESLPFSASHALTKIDASSILFFLGILLAIGALESDGILHHFSAQLNETFKNQDVIVILIGIFSAIVDNVPLVAATMGMYDLQHFPTDHKLWEFLAYCSGTGGSILIIGSAAGVAIMGMEKISFSWYLKNISWLALLGYFSGAIAYLLFY